jgi:hypothetical protein
MPEGPTSRHTADLLRDVLGVNLDTRKLIKERQNEEDKKAYFKPQLRVGADFN